LTRIVFYDFLRRSFARRSAEWLRKNVGSWENKGESRRIDIRLKEGSRKKTKKKSP
jgi:hypothetical protein